MKTENKMEINKENALKLWASKFGKKQKVKDFAGREIMRSAYDDRNSKYGWNIDHILPQSQGGKSNESNLICCSILTNDEKQNSFPCFSANDKNFEIKRVQNHFEIFEKNQQNNTDDSVNFFSAAEGMDYFNSLLNGDADLCYSCVSINIRPLDNEFLNPICEFVKRIFLDLTDNQTEIIFGDCLNHNGFFTTIQSMYRIYILNRNSILDEQTQNMLDICILLKTYFEYFIDKYISDFGILLKTDFVDYEFSNQDTKSVLDNFCMYNNINENQFVIDKNTKKWTEMNKKDLYPYSINYDSNYYICNYINSKVYNELNKNK